MNRVKARTAGVMLASAVALAFLATPSHAQESSGSKCTDKGGHPEQH